MLRRGKDARRRGSAVVAKNIRSRFVRTMLMAMLLLVTIMDLRLIESKRHQNGG